jgi:heptosyltransferase I
LSPTKILLVRLGALGDIVHAIPVAAALREQWPGARIDWLVDARHAAILELVPAVDRRIAADTRTIAGWLGLVRRLRHERYDAAVDMQGLIKSAALARLSGAARVIGFERAHLRERAAAVFYGESCRVPSPAHVVDKNLSLLAAFGVAGRERRFPIDVPPSASEGPIASRVSRDGARGFALINPGAAWPNKRWPPARFGAVASAVAARHGLLSVVLWGPGEDGIAREVVEASRGAAMVAPPTGIADVLALARNARLMVSGDTGPLHLAGAMGAPLVAIFGPTDPARNGPWSAADVSLSRFGECVCRYRRRCRRRRACIEDVTVEDVSGAIDRRLAVEPHA